MAGNRGVPHRTIESRTIESRTIESTVDDAVSVVHDAVDGVKPHLRGWLHAFTAPAALACGIILVVLARPEHRLAAVVYMLSVTALFTTSGLYHRGRWSPRVRDLFERLDHSMIFVLIAGSYTPFAVIVLEGTAQVAVLAVVWGGAALGIALRFAMSRMRRAVFVPLYLALGWAGVAVMPQIHSGAGLAVLVLVLVGGGLYSLGALVYATRRPDPSPRWFGFHEVFHVFTIAAFIVHYIAVSIATYTTPT